MSDFAAFREAAADAELRWRERIAALRAERDLLEQERDMALLRLEEVTRGTRQDRNR